MAKVVRGNSCGVSVNLKHMQEGGKTYETKGPGNRGKIVKGAKKDKDEDK